jgi:hypothetical protein
MCDASLNKLGLQNINYQCDVFVSPNVPIVRFDQIESEYVNSVWAVRIYMSVRIHQTSDSIKSDPNTSTRTGKSELIKSDPNMYIRIGTKSYLINSDWAVRIYRLDRLNVHNRSILSYIVDCHSIVTRGGAGVSSWHIRIRFDRIGSEYVYSDRNKVRICQLSLGSLNRLNS